MAWQRFAVRLRAWFFIGSCIVIAPAAMAATPVDTIRADLDALIRAAADSQSQFAVSVSHPVSVTTHGTWSTVGDRAVWEYSAQIPTAISLSLHAADSSLPDGSALVLRSSGSERYSYTEADLRNGELWSRIVPGDLINLTLTIPAARRADVAFRIVSFQAGYRALGGDHVKDHPAYRKMKIAAAMNASSAYCVENYACHVSANNAAAGHSTVALVVGGQYQCTGTLINDVPGDNVPYVITARHCQTGKLGGGNPGAAITIVVYWNAVSACGAVLGTLYDPGTMAQFGATTLVEQQDTWLIRLDASPVVTDAQFAGFNASGGPVIGGYTVHHALGFNKQYTEWFGQAALLHESGVLGVLYQSDFLEAVNQLGTAGPGASGSGLFDQNHRLVGTLSLGRSNEEDPSGYGRCPAPSPSAPNGSNGLVDFTSLAAIWNSTADTTSLTTRTLKDVLDPDNTGIKNVASALAATMSFTSSTYSLAIGGTAQLTWDAPGATQCTATGGATGDGWAGTTSAASTRQVSATVDGLVTYTLTCQLAGSRTVKASVTIRWGSATPFIDFRLPDYAWSGAFVKISWVANVAPCSISGGNLSLVDLPSTGSTYVKQDTPADIRYTITCGPQGNRVTRDQTIGFMTPSLTFQVNGTDRRIGEEFFLQWMSVAESCVPAGGAPNDGWTTTAFPNPRTFPRVNLHVTTPGSYVYTLTCTTGTVSVTKSIPVKFENDAPYVNLTLDKTSATFSMPPDYFHLSWKSNLSYCGPQSEPSTGGFISDAFPDGSATNYFNPGTYKLSVVCNGTVQSNAVTVTVLPPPPPEATVTISPATVALGEEFTVTWTSAYSANCTASEGIPDSVFNVSGILSGSRQYTPTTPGQFAFKVSCVSIAPGQPSTQAQATITVTDTPPVVSLSANASSVKRGSDFTLTWSSQRASSCLASGGGASGTPFSGKIETSGTTHESASVAGTFTYTVTCTVGPRSTQVQTNVTVTGDAPGGGGSGGGRGGGSLEWMTLAILALLFAARSQLPRASSALRQPRVLELRACLRRNGLSCSTELVLPGSCFSPSSSRPPFLRRRIQPPNRSTRPLARAIWIKPSE